MYCDSKAAIAISCNPVQHSRTKHSDVRYHFIKEKVEMCIVELFFVGTEYWLANLFTKALPEERFKYLVRRLGKRRNYDWLSAGLWLGFVCVSKGYYVVSSPTVDEHVVGVGSTKDVNVRKTPISSIIDLNLVPLESIRAISERFVNMAYGPYMSQSAGMREGSNAIQSPAICPDDNDEPTLFSVKESVGSSKIFPGDMGGRDLMPSMSRVPSVVKQLMPMRPE
nr:putative RNA-directed DNA polymerase [Tanacetum cinerariifolium]